MTCSATDTTLDPVTSATVTLCLLAAFKSMWLVVSSGAHEGAGTYSDPTPAVTASLSFLAFSKRSAVRYPGWKGVVMRISVYHVSLVLLLHLHSMWTHVVNLLLED